MEEIVDHFYLLDEIYDDEDTFEEIDTSKYDEIRKIASDVVVYTTDWTTETVVSQIRKGNIDLNPSFQRRNAWQDDKKSKFIESLFLGLPIPPIVLAASKDDKGKFIVIDGKQRLLTIMQFSAPDSNDFHELRLSKLNILDALNGKTRKSMDETLIHSKEGDITSDSFDNQPIRTVIIKNWQADSILYEIFLRLNQGSLQLSPQELRQALLQGPFSDFIDLASSNNPSIRQILGLTEPDRRMRDAELLIRYYAFKNFIENYDGDLKSFFDLTSNTFNRRWSDRKSSIEEQLNEFDNAYEAAKLIFGEKNVFRKWLGTSNKYESRLNRAIFDVLMFYLSNSEIRSKILLNKEVFTKKYKDLFDNDPKFKASVESSTKNLIPTKYRFEKIAEVISSTINEDIIPPRIKIRNGVDE